MTRRELQRLRAPQRGLMDTAIQNNTAPQHPAILENIHHGWLYMSEMKNYFRCLLHLTSQWTSLYFNINIQDLYETAANKVWQLLCPSWKLLLKSSALQGHEGCLHPGSSSWRSNYCLSLFDASRVRPTHLHTLRQFPGRRKGKPISCWQGKTQQGCRRVWSSKKRGWWGEWKTS